ncbi:MAG: cupin domain-containing protein [Halioglobus sp.]|nr:cupin domain-containing protein [Halioglobus sp.]
MKLRLDISAFLARHWQREPLLVRNAVAQFKPPISADELAGLALEDSVESRLVTQRGQRWQVRHGPFTTTDLQLEQPFTLLVQAVDHYVPEVEQLLRAVDFIPAWRIDDIMVSYGTDGASVGPHYDHYDVFLLQGEGAKRWRIGQRCDASTPLLDNEEMRILRDFQPTADYLLQTGDMLYVPPGVAHWGIAEGDSTTFSIGFRAPRRSDMLARWADQMLAGIGSDAFFGDAGRKPSAATGEITREDRQQARATLRRVIEQLDDDRWFGELVTEPRYDCTPDASELAQAQSLLRAGPTRMLRNPAAVLAWQHNDPTITAFANGESLTLDASPLLQTALEQLCGEWYLEGTLLSSLCSDGDARSLLDFLLATGSAHVE